MNDTKIPPKEVKPKPEIVEGALLSISVDALKQNVAREAEMRDVLRKYVATSFQLDVDYGGIEMTNKSGAKFKSKPSLLKPGAEKLLSLFQLRAQYVRDDETWTMAGEIGGLFCYEAHILNQNGQIVGFGKGACNVKEKFGNENNAIKIAKKRALVDAVLSALGLSDMFTQDMEGLKAESNQLPAVKKNNSQKAEALVKLIEGVKSLEQYEQIKPNLIAQTQALPATFQQKVLAAATAKKQSLTPQKNDN